MTTKTRRPIPKSVFAVLDKTWRDADTGYRAFDPIFNERGRARDPSYYFSAWSTGFSDAELARMAKEGVFKGAMHGYNEHAIHAMHDFCNDVYQAWGVCQERLARAAKAEKVREK